MADREISELTAADTLDGDELVHIDQGGNSRKATLSSVVALSTGAMLVSEYDPNDDGIIAVAQGGTGGATASGARTNLGLGTIAVQNAATVAITGGSVTGITDLAVADGGTGGSDASTARTNLGLVIGTDVQAYSANLAGFAATTTANVQNRVNHTGTQLADTISDFSTASDLRIAAAVDVTVQAYSATLDDWSAIAPATKLDASVIPAAEDGKILSWTGTSLVNKTAGELGTFVVGEDVQAYSANLDAWSALATSDKQDASANLTTLAGIAPGAAGQTILADTDGEATHDLVVATPGLLRNRNLDQVLFTDFMATSKQSDYRDGDNPDITQELNDADAALSANGTLIIPKKAGIISGTVSKKPGTNWLFNNSTIGDTWTGNYDGTLIDIQGTGVSLDGSMIGMRLNSNNTTYPNAIGINANDIFTHKFKDMRVQGFNYGMKFLDSSALICENLYVTNCLLDGVVVEGTTLADSSDCRFFDCQFTGDRYGLRLENTATPRLTACRPQASGIANLYGAGATSIEMSGGFCDSGAINSLGGGNGARFVNCQGIVINGVNFYTNGDGDPHIVFFSTGDDATARTEHVRVALCRFTKGSGQTSVEGITFSTPSGTGGAYRHIIIVENSFASVDNPVTGLNNINYDLRVGLNNGNTTAMSPVQTVTNTSGAVEIDAITEVVRCTGTLTGELTLTLTGKGNYVGKTVEVYRTGGGAFNIVVKRPDGTTTVKSLTAAGEWVKAYCSTSSTTPASAVFLAVN